MNSLWMGLVCVLLLLLLIASGVQLSFSFILSGFVISYFIIGFNSTISLIGQSAYHSVATPTWTAIPLFTLMGAFAAYGGYAYKAYNGVYAVTSKVKGSLAIATCFGCAFFGLLSGSSLAATGIFGKMVFPEMQRYGYDKKLSAACIASAGTFASMIPPSMLMIIYAMFTQQSVGRLFAAGVIPGILTSVAYVLYILWTVNKHPDRAPKTSDMIFNSEQKRKALLGTWPVILIGFIVLGGIYSGLFTPTEAGGIGAVVTLLFAFFQGSIRKVNVVMKGMQESAGTTSMLLIVNICALFYSRVLGLTRLPSAMSLYLTSLDIPRIFILIGVLLIMFILGMIMVPVGIYALTLPIIFPLIVSLGYDPIWFGVMCLKMTEIGAVTPPVGLNVYTMKAVLPSKYELSIQDIFSGVWPFVVCDCFVLVLLLICPQMVTWLPNLLFG